MTDRFLTARKHIISAIRAASSSRSDIRLLLSTLETSDRDASFDELGMDSLSRMELCISLECELNASVAEKDIVESKTINTLAHLLTGILEG